MEIALPFFLPSWLQRFRPCRIGGLISAFVDGRRGALEHVEVLGIPTQMRYELHTGGPRADERNTLVTKLVQSAAGISAGVLIVPARRVEDVSLEVLDPRDAGQLRPVVRAGGQDHEAGSDVVAAVGVQPPALDRFVPAHRAHLSGEDRPVVEPEMLSDTPAVLVDLRTVGELLRRDVVEFLQHRDVAVRIVVTLDAGKAVPVPDAAEVPTHLDDAYLVDAGLLEVGGRQQSRDATAEDGDLDVLRDRFAGRHRRVRVDLRKLGELTLQLEILRRTFWAQPLVALLQVLLSQCVDVD